MNEAWPAPLADLLDYLDGIGYGELYLRPPAAAPAVAAASVASPSPAAAAPSASTVAGPDGPSADRHAELAALGREAAACTACRLAQGRKSVVFGSGNPDAELMFIGEGPGAEEDLQGLPFVGPAGQLLTRIIEAIGVQRQDVYIANVVKCRPPNNRDPAPDEAAACRHFLERQIDLIKPRVIVALGRVAAQTLLATAESLGRLRGHWHEVRGVPTRATYHPAALLRYPQYKRPTWEDMQVVRDRLRER